MKFSYEMKRSGVTDEAESKSVEVASFAEATFLLVEDLVKTAEQQWSTEIIEEWLRQSSHFVNGKPSAVTVEKDDHEDTHIFSFES